MYLLFTTLKKYYFYFKISQMELASLASLFHKWRCGDLNKESVFAFANATKLEAKLILIVFLTLFV